MEAQIRIVGKRIERLTWIGFQVCYCMENTDEACPTKWPGTK